MARKSHFDTDLEYANRCILAWEALRLNSDYRKDWDANKILIKRPAAHKIQTKTHQQLYKAASKWGIRWLVDPVNTPVTPPNVDGFRHCQRKCGVSFSDPGWFYNKKCVDKKNAGQCFRDFYNVLSKNPFISRWNTAWVTIGNPLPPDSPLLKRYGKFTIQEETKGRLVLWIRKGGIRNIIQDHVIEYYKAKRKKLKKQFKKTEKEIAVLAGGDFIILSIPPSLSIDQLRRKVSGILDKHIVTISLTQIKDMWTDLKIFEKRKYLGKTIDELLKEYYPRTIDFSRRGGDSFYRPKIWFRYGFAKNNLLNPDRFVPPPLSLVKPFLPMKQA